jgi:hypothetical protein
MLTYKIKSYLDLEVLGHSYKIARPRGIFDEAT